MVLENVLFDVVSHYEVKLLKICKATKSASKRKRRKRTSESCYWMKWVVFVLLMRCVMSVQCKISVLFVKFINLRMTHWSVCERKDGEQRGTNC